VENRCTCDQASNSSVLMHTREINCTYYATCTIRKNSNDNLSCKSRLFWFRG
jgi:hypothetical protein